MIALSILQPWAWLIVRPDLTDPAARAVAVVADEIKDVENRTWSTRRRGDILIHAGKKWGRQQRDDLEHVRARFPSIPLPDTFDLGGIVGAARIVDCVEDSTSPWFSGPYGFVLANTRPAPRFVPWKGQLGFFDVPRSALEDTP